MPSRKATRLFHEALKLEPEDRLGFLKKAAGKDLKLVKEVESLLTSHEKAGDFLEDSVARPVMRLIKEAAPVPKLVPGDTLGDFVIQKELGSGGMATVYLARQKSLGRDVALKVSLDAGLEARTMAPLDHDNIVKIFGETILAKSGLRLVAMQFVPGSDLQRIFSEAASRNLYALDGKALLTLAVETASAIPSLEPSSLRERQLMESLDPFETTVWVGLRLAEALGAAHASGVLHLDIKPANVLVSPYGRPLLADFNVAMRRGEGEASGRALRGATLRYVAPEQLAALERPREEWHDALDGRADLYSLGVLLREMFLLTVPRCRVDGPVAGKAFSRLLDRCTAHDREARFDSAQALARALRNCLDVHAFEKSLPRLGSFQVDRHAGLVATVSLLSPPVVALVNLFEIARSDLLGLPIHALSAHGLALVAGAFVLLRWWRRPQGSRPSERLLVLPLFHCLAHPVASLVSYCVMAWLFLEGRVAGASFVAAHWMKNTVLAQALVIGLTSLSLVWVVVSSLYPRELGKAAVREATARDDIARLARRLLLVNGGIAGGLLALVAALSVPFFFEDPRPLLSMAAAAAAAVLGMSALLVHGLLSRVLRGLDSAASRQGTPSDASRPR